jgi:hypothetical protein
MAVVERSIERSIAWKEDREVACLQRLRSLPPEFFSEYSYQLLAGDSSANRMGIRNGEREYRDA